MKPGLTFIQSRIFTKTHRKGLSMLPLLLVVLLCTVVGSALPILVCRIGYNKAALAANVIGSALPAVAACWFWQWQPDWVLPFLMSSFVGWILSTGVLIFVDEMYQTLYEGTATLDFSDYLAEKHSMPGRGCFVTAVVPGIGRVQHASMQAYLIERFREEGAERAVRVVVARNPFGCVRVITLWLPGYEAPISYAADFAR